MPTILFAKRSAALCLAMSFALAIVSTGDGSAIANENQTGRAGATKQTAKPAGSASSNGQKDTALRARANRLHRQSIVIDTHNDITSPLIDDGFDLAMRGDDPNAKI